MAPAAGEPSPPQPQPGGWLSGLVTGAGRILAGVAAVLGPDSASDGTSSFPESSQSPPRQPLRRSRQAADQANGTNFPYDTYQFNKSGMEIVLKDVDNGSLDLLSDLDRKNVLTQLLMQETFSRSEYDALTKIIQERIVDEPDPVLPITWEPSKQQRPVALSPKNSPPRTSSDPAYSLLFENTSKKEGLRKNATILKDPCTLKNLSHDQCRHVVKRDYSNTVGTFDEPRRVMPKLNRLNTSEIVFDAVIADSDTNDAGGMRGFPEEFKGISLHGTDNLTFSKIASNPETSKPVRHLATTSSEANMEKHGFATFCPYSYQDLTETFPLKVEPFDEFASLKLAQKNDERTMSSGSCSVSKMVFQEDMEAAPSSSDGRQRGNSSRNHKKGFDLQGSIPTKARSPANSSHRINNRRKIRSWNGPSQQSNLASVGQETNARPGQAKRPVGRPRKAKRSRNTDRDVKTKRRLQL